MLSPIHEVFTWKIYAARRDCYLIDFNSFLSFNRCLMTKNLHKSIKFEDRYYIFYISTEYIDLWRFFVIEHSLKDKKWIEINQITISSCSVYLSGKYYTMDWVFKEHGHRGHSEDRYYIFYISCEYLLYFLRIYWFMEVFLQITISSCIVYLSGEYCTMDQVYSATIIRVFQQARL